MSAAVDNNVALHDDPPVNKLFSSWYNGGTNGRFNPVNPEDRDNNGANSDPKNSPAANSTVCTIDPPGGRLGHQQDPPSIPCDDPNVSGRLRLGPGRPLFR